MIIVLRPEATEAQVNHIIEKVKKLGFDVVEIDSNGKAVN